MAKRHWYTGLRGACKVPRTLLGWWYEIKPRAFLDRYALDPDRYCSDCAKAARLALAKESAQKPAEVSERPNCGDKRTDSERYAELRALVEKWQAAHREHDQVKTTAPETEGRLKRWLNFCDAQKPLLDWNHR